MTGTRVLCRNIIFVYDALVQSFPRLKQHPLYGYYFGSSTGGGIVRGTVAFTKIIVGQVRLDYCASNSIDIIFFG